MKAKDTLGGTPTNRYRVVWDTDHEPSEGTLDECLSWQAEDDDAVIERLYTAHTDDLNDEGTWIEVK